MPARRLVCSFLPRPLSLGDIADWLAQMIQMHSGIRVTVETDCVPSAIKVFVNDGDDLATVRTAIDTNRQDWRGAGLEESAA